MVKGAVSPCLHPSACPQGEDRALSASSGSCCRCMWAWGLGCELSLGYRNFSSQVKAPKYTLKPEGYKVLLGAKEFC